MAADIDDIELTDASIVANPYPFFARLREAGEVVWLKKRRSWLVSRYDTIHSLLRDKRLSANSFFRQLGRMIVAPDRKKYQRVIDLFSNAIAFTDEPEHGRLRKFMNQGFTPDVIEGLQPEIEKVVHEQLDRVGNAPAFDAARDLAHQIPVNVIADMLGVPEEDRQRVHGWSKTMVEFFGNMPIPAQVADNILNTIEEMTAYLRPIVDDARRNPKGDFLSHLVGATGEGREFQGERVYDNLLSLLVGGNETTRHLLTNTIDLLLSHPEQWQRLKEEPALVDSAIEESLRFEAPVQLIGRRTLEEMDIKGVRIRKNQSVGLLVGAGNRDPNQFARADQFDITRTENKHLSFGIGMHYCLGAALARLETKTMLTALLQRIPRLRFNEAEPKQRTTGFSMRGYDVLPVLS